VKKNHIYIYGTPIKIGGEIIMPERDKILVTRDSGAWQMRYPYALEGLGKLKQSHSHFILHPEQYKLVLFTGGEDVTPSLYGETSPRRQCFNSIRRDIVEKRIFETAMEHDIKIAGICRGIQFCHVMAGGKLIHHMNNHEGKKHWMNVTTQEGAIPVNSYHHQMVIPNEDTVLVGWSRHRRSTIYVGDGDELVVYKGPEVEAILIPKINFCGVQYHPELLFKTEECYQFFYRMVEDLLTLTKPQLLEKYPGKEEEYKHGNNLFPRGSVRTRRKGTISQTRL
jgi:gamma-glutamyl-gamma-aminobutyrate hydrolase PuuD